MNHSDLLGRTFDCECGRTHSVGVESVLYEEDAYENLAPLVERFATSRVVNLVADSRTVDVAGNAVREALDGHGFSAHLHVLPDASHGGPVCDDTTRERLESGLVLPCGMLIAVGSGTINDLCKWIASDRGVPYLVVATAASMNGYASENIAPAIGGVKRVLHGTVPKAVVTKPSVLAQAPFELTGAGLGDALAKPVGVTDWKVSHVLFDEYYCPFCAGMIDELEPLYLGTPAAIRVREPGAIRALFDALVYSGLSMTLAGTSFPSSGGEHLVSHVLDMIALRDGTEHDLHGRQVGVGTICACALYERLVALESPAFAVRVEDTDAAYWGSLAKVVEEEHAGKRRQAAAAVECLKSPGVWDRVRETVDTSSRTAGEIKHCLAAAGAAHCLGDIGCSRDRFIEAFLHCHQIRERYTVVDLARAAGILPGAIHEIVEEWL